MPQGICCYISVTFVFHEHGYTSIVLISFCRRDFYKKIYIYTYARKCCAHIFRLLVLCHMQRFNMFQSSKYHASHILLNASPKFKLIYKFLVYWIAWQQKQVFVVISALVTKMWVLKNCGNLRGGHFVKSIKKTLLTTRFLWVFSVVSVVKLIPKTLQSIYS